MQRDRIRRVQFAAEITDVRENISVRDNSCGPAKLGFQARVLRARSQGGGGCLPSKANAIRAGQDQNREKLLIECAITAGTSQLQSELDRLLDRHDHHPETTPKYTIEYYRHGGSV